MKGNLMSRNKLHNDEIDINAALVKQLLASQFPGWADLRLRVLSGAGTDNAMYKLGDDKVVRLPRTARSATNIDKERLWLPKLAPCLPISIPTILGKGSPAATYPLPWLIYRWLEGQTPNTESMLDRHLAAIDLGNFVVEMKKISSVNGPKSKRGQPLSTRDEETRFAITSLTDTYDVSVLIDMWESALTSPLWSEAPVWIHGDLHAGNVLTQNHRVTAVVDFGSAGVGDPACDMMVAWTLLTPETRQIFRSIVQPDHATWARGRGWALTFGIVAYPYYRISNPTLARIAKRTIEQTIADYKYPDQ